MSVKQKARKKKKKNAKNLCGIVNIFALASPT
jgi:hypothetical protein